jgi:pyrimidine operon attenuation protein/uracil phosphoribosyltransferase
MPFYEVLPIGKIFLLPERGETMKQKAQIMDTTAISRAMARITHEIIERNRGVEGICLLGVRRRGIPLAEMLAANIARFEGKQVPLGYLDITCHRDDIPEEERGQLLAERHIPCDVREKTVIIVDDVLYTGRTARAAMGAVFADGRPKAIQLAVLIDRGHRELPIRPDYVGKNVPTSKNELVSVMLSSYDGEDAVYISDL